MNLKKRLISNLYPIGIAFIFLIILASLLVLSINKSAQEIIFESDPPIKVMEYFLLDIFNDNILLARYLETTTIEETIPYDRSVHSSYERDLVVKREIEELLTSKEFNNQRVIDYYQEAKAVHDNVIIKRNEIITLHKEALATENDLSKEKQTLLEEHQVQFESAQGRISQIIAQINLDNKEVQERLVSQIKLYTILILVILIGFIAILIYRILRFSNEIIDPLQAIMDKTKRFARGDYRVRASSKTNISEIKDLEKNINNVFKAIEENTSSQKTTKTKKMKLLKKEYHQITEYIKKNMESKKQTTISDLKHSLQVTHPTILNRLKYLEMNGYIKIVKTGREKVIELNDKLL